MVGDFWAEAQVFKVDVYFPLNVVINYFALPFRDRRCWF